MAKASNLTERRKRKRSAGIEETAQNCRTVAAVGRNDLALLEQPRQVL